MTPQRQKRTERTALHLFLMIMGTLAAKSDLSFFGNTLFAFAVLHVAGWYAVRRGF